MSIKDINPATPASTDPVGQGDDQIRALKSAIQACFSNLDGLISNAGGSGTTGNDANPPNAETFSKLFDDVRTLTTGAGSGVIPIGGIVLWSGSLGTIPAGWALCDGLNGTPNLEDRFVIGAGNATYSVGATGGSTTSGSGGAGSGTATLNLPDHTITTDNLPEHTHKLFGGDATATELLVGTNDAAAAKFENGSNAYNRYAISQNATNPSTIEPTLGRSSKAGGVASVVPLTHPPTDITINGIAHTHDVTPPYYALAYIMRTA